MEFLKKNLFLTILIAIVLVATIAMSVLIKNFSENVKKQEKEVELIIKAEKGFANSPYALVQENVTQAEANYKMIAENFAGLIKTLNEKYPAPEVNADMTALKFKNFLRQVCIRMENLLRSGDIWMPDALKYFTYDQYMKPDVLPKNAEIKQVLKQLEIIQEVVYLVSQSQVNKLLDLKRLNDLKFVKRDLYDYMRFRLVVSGNVEAIQRLLNSFHEAKYFILVKGLSLKADPIKQNSKGGSRSQGAQKVLSQYTRPVYAQDAKVTADISLNYFVFHDKE